MARMKELSLFHYFLISHLALIVLMILALILVNQIYTRNFRDMMVQSAERELSESAELFELHLDEAWNTAYSLSQNNGLSAFSRNSQLSIADYAKMYELNRSIKSYYQNNAFISDMLIFFPASESIWSGRHGFILPPLVERAEQDSYIINGLPFRQYIQNCQGRDFTSYLDQASIGFGTTRTLQFVYYINLYPLSNFQTRACALILLNPAPIQSLFAFSAYHENGGFFALSDLTERQLMNTAEPEENKLQKNDLVSEYRPYKSQYIYRLYVPAAYIANRVRNVQLISFLIAVALSVLAIALSYFFSHLHVKPVRQLVTMVSGGAPKQNELHFLHDSIHQMLNDRKRLEDNLRQQTALYTNMVFTRLLAYEYRSEDDALDALARVGVIPSFSRYAAVFVHIQPTDKTENLQSNVIIYNLLSGILTDTLCLYQLTAHNYVIFTVCKPGDGADYLAKRMEGAIEEIRKSYTIYLECVIGTIVSSLLSLPHSLHSTQRKYYSIQSQPHSHVMTADEKDAAEFMSWILPDEEKRRLTYLCKTGNYSLIQECVSGFFAQKKAAAPIGKYDLLQLCFDFRSLFFAIQAQFSVAPVSSLLLSINSLTSAQSEAELQESVLAVFRQFCDQVDAHYEDRGYRQYIHVKNYVNEHFTDPDFSLTSIADAFGLSDKYLSALYKKNGNVNLASEIENLRLNRAVELMSDDQLSLTEICQAAGYSNSNTFYKAFKRVYGLSPSQYRSCQARPEKRGSLDAEEDA